MTRRAFTLIEMIVATAVAALLTGALLAALSGVSRDRAKLTAAESQPQPRRLLDLLRWDLTNADSVRQIATGFVLEGHGGIDRKTLSPTGRLTRVTYHVRRDAAGSMLLREQIYLDDRIRPEPWVELLGVGVTRIAVGPPASSLQTAPVLLPTWSVPVSARMKVRIEMRSSATDELMWVR